MMEPSDYLRLVRRRWRLLVLCVFVAAAVAWVTSPAEGGEQTVEYTAEATILRDAQLNAPSPATVALFVETGAVPRTVAERLDFEGNPLVLPRRIDIDIDDVVGTIAITATATSRDEAAELANLFTEETLALLDGRADDLRRDQIEGFDERVEQLESEIALLGAGIVEAEGSNQPTDLLDAQRDAAVGQLVAARNERQQVIDEPPASGGYALLEAADPELASVKSEGFSAPRTKPVRSALGALIGLLLGAGAVIAVERFDTRIHTRRSAEEAFDLPVVAEIAYDRELRKGGSIVSITHPSSSQAEGYRSLRAALVLMPAQVLGELPGAGRSRTADGAGPGDEPRVVLVTSPQPGDGKTSTVANLACAFAETGRTVLVLGCDFRRPQIQRYFDIGPGPGISDVLHDHEGAIVLDDVIRPTTVKGVRVATSGSAMKNLGDVAAAGRRLVATARAKADVVIIDTPPLLATTEATELIPAVDAVVLACRGGSTSGSAARRSRRLLEQLGAPVTGVAMVGGAADETAYASYGSYYATRAPTPETGRRWRRRRRRLGGADPADPSANGAVPAATTTSVKSAGPSGGAAPRGTGATGRTGGNRSTAGSTSKKANPGRAGGRRRHRSRR